MMHPALIIPEGKSEVYLLPTEDAMVYLQLDARLERLTQPADPWSAP